MATICRTFRLTGLVQGVGFRPTLWRAAVDNKLTGYVYNDAAGVTAAVEGPAEIVEKFPEILRERLAAEAPLARLDSVEILKTSAPLGFADFAIRESQGGEAHTMVTPDAATCKACALDMFSPGNRRWRYAFTNCTHCGPRFTITRHIPYDRKETSMASFAMCPACLKEYQDPADRRFHAQPNACPVCGPKLFVTDRTGKRIACEDAIAFVLEKIKAGAIVAVKGLGGFHLACDALNPAAVSVLRKRKARDEKPFALMTANCASAERFCRISAKARELLTAPAHPIVLCPKVEELDSLMPDVAPGLNELGVMLAYTPVHLLLFHEAAGRPSGVDWLENKVVDLTLVMTSANPGGEPLVIGNSEAIERLSGIADWFLMNDRDIVTRCDDSVVRVIGDDVRPVRRSRGFTPLSVKTKLDMTGIVGVGPALKVTGAVGRGNEVYLTEHVGETDNPSTCRHLKEAVDHFLDILEVAPKVIVHDLHPDFYSTQLALELGEKFHCPVTAVQHHHAHIAGVAHEFGIFESPYYGLALDGVGLGTDNTAWGGELLKCHQGEFTRLGHLEPMALPGGDKAAREPWRMGAVLCDMVGSTEAIAKLWPKYARLPIVPLIHNPRLTIKTTSMGRLFDGVAALAGLLDVQHDEARAAMLLECAAENAGSGPYPVMENGWRVMLQNECRVLSVVPLIKKLLDLRLSGTDAGSISQYFHGTLSAGLADWVRQTVPAGSNVCLSGGTFLNRFLSIDLIARLKALGYAVYISGQLPCGDGGVSFGQTAVAAERIAAGTLSAAQ